MSPPIQSVELELWTEFLSYPKKVSNFLILFIYQRFEGVEAPEGPGKVPAIHTIIFSSLILCRNFLEVCASCLLCWTKNITVFSRNVQGSKPARIHRWNLARPYILDVKKSVAMPSSPQKAQFPAGERGEGGQFKESLEIFGSIV
jgi:hypothetical protein